MGVVGRAMIFTRNVIIAPNKKNFMVACSSKTDSSMSPRSWSSATLVPCKDFAGEKVAVTDFWREWRIHPSSTIHWTSRKDQLNPSHVSVCVCSHWSMDLKLKKLCSWNAGGSHQSKGSKCNNRTMRSNHWQLKLQTLLGAAFLLGTWIQMQKSISKCHAFIICLSGFCCMKCDRSSHLLQKKSASLHHQRGFKKTSLF